MRGLTLLKKEIINDERRFLPVCCYAFSAVYLDAEPTDPKRYGLSGFHCMLLAVTQTEVRTFFASAGSMNHQFGLWELIDKDLKKCGEVSEDKDEILETVFGWLS